MPTGPLDNSTYLDFTSYRTTDATTVEEAYGLTFVAPAPPQDRINVALVLGRAHDASALLSSDWGTRQQALSALDGAGALWSTYGADAQQYNAVKDWLEAHHFALPGADQGYVASPESRTIWATVDAASFESLFGTPLLSGIDADGHRMLFWEGGLSLPEDWNVTGLWFDINTNPAVSDLSGGVTATLPQGPQSIGNPPDTRNSELAQDLGRQFFDFPEGWATQQTGTIGLIEPIVGSALPAGSESFEDLLDAFRHKMGIPGTSQVYTVNAAHQDYNGSKGERSLDVGIVTSAAPNSTIGLYVGSGVGDGAGGSTFTAYQQAIWDLFNDPEVLSSSFGGMGIPSPGSPFANAVNELFADAALRSVSVVLASGDGGSGRQIANGIPNHSSVGSPYILMTGGVQVSGRGMAEADPTLASLVADVEARDKATIWNLVPGGLKSLADVDANPFIQTVWNSYRLDGDELKPGYLMNNASGGGVDTSQEIPWYQRAYGLDPRTADPGHLPGRGIPDVASESGPALGYTVPSRDLTEVSFGGAGTSAAAPLWASITAHLDAEFAAIGLPRLGFANDLYYTAAVVAPASFNDVRYGNNVSTYVENADSPIFTPESGQEGALQVPVTPTGYGYEAGPGYDLTTGLGTPNATVLARSLMQIATAQYFFDTPAVLEAAESGGWTSTVDQTLLIQTALPADAHAAVAQGGLDVTAGAPGDYAWSRQFAQLALQPDFAPEIVTLFDRQAQGTLAQTELAAGADFSVEIGGQPAAAPQAELSSPYGFVDFTAPDGAGVVNVARAVAVAQTAQHADDQDVVVRLRQNGVEPDKVLFYKVDDFSGSIGHLKPGDVGYATASLARAYLSGEGDSWILGAGYGEYKQTTITGVDAGDLIAMRLNNGSEDFYAFAQANESVDGQRVGHLWNYGLNTWGWEDVHGGGDHDFNDLVVQLDFTSHAGHDWLI